MKNKYIKNNKKLFFVTSILILFIFNLFSFNYSFVYAEENNNLIKIEIQNNIQNIYLNNFENIKNRISGSSGEKNMANILCDYLEEKNIDFFFNDTYLQEFSFDKTKSQNVAGLINNNSEKYIVLGAHYDSVYVSGKSFGYSDNFSGVLAVLSLINYFSSTICNYNIIVVFYGAEEVGSKGSEFFVKNLDGNIKNNILLSFNFDSIGAGDYLYYYHSDFKTKYGTVLDKLLNNYNFKNASGKLVSPLTYRNFNYTALGLNSDNSTYLRAGINSILFFAGNIENSCSYKETKSTDKIMHNTDSYENIEKIFGEKYIENIEKTILITENLVFADDFNENYFFPNQINPIIFSPWVLKFFGVFVVGVLFVVYLVVIKPKYSNNK